MVALPVVFWACVIVGVLAMLTGFVRGFLNDSDVSSEGVWFRTALQGMIFLASGVFGLFLLGDQNLLFPGFILFGAGALAIFISAGEGLVQNVVRLFGALFALSGIFVVIYSMHLL